MKLLTFLKPITLMMAVGFLSFFAACSSDDEGPDPTFDAPVISISGDNTALFKPGETISITFAIEAEAGAESLVVNFGGGFLDEVTLDPEATSVTYSGQSVPLDVEEGDLLAYDFILKDLAGQESSPVTFTADVALYDQIEVGSATLFDVDIPTDGIIEGVNYKFVTGRNYFVSNTMDFQEGTVFTIQEGVHVYTDPEAEFAVDIIIRPGAEANIQGTATNPVVFTTANVLSGEPAPGDWGWLNIRGNGPGTNSGIIRYVRIEYAGSRAFRLQDVGNGTTISHVQVFKAAGEGIMPTEGDVNMKYLVATNCEGGGFRIGDTYSGQLQFLLALLTERFADNEELIVREEASPVISNVTLIGPGTDADNTAGMRFRAASSAKVYNSIIAEFPRRGLRLNDNVEVTDLNGPTVFAYSFIFNVPTDPYRDDSGNGNPFQGIMDNGDLVNPFFNNILGFDNGDPILDVIDGIGIEDYLPDSEQISAFDPSGLGAFFAPASYVGAFKDGSDDWTSGWVKNPDGTIR